MEMVLFIGSFYWFKDNFVFRKMKTRNIFQRNWFEFSAIKINILQTMKPKQDWWKSKVKVKWWKTFYLLLVTFCWLSIIFYSLLYTFCSLLVAFCLLQKQPMEMLCNKKNVLKKFASFTEKHLCLESLFKLVSSLRAWGPKGLRVFSYEICKFAKNSYEQCFYCCS